jgi:hypothetical protein
MAILSGGVEKTEMQRGEAGHSKSCTGVRRSADADVGTPPVTLSD